MRKLIVVGVVAALMLTVMAASIFAQDTETPASSGVWLGIAVVEQDEQVIVARVQSGSPADAADLLIGDIITSVNGTAVTSASALSEQIQAAAGDTVTILVVRNGAEVSVDVTLTSLPSGILGGRFGRGLGQGWTGDALSIAERLVIADLEEADGGYEVVEVSENVNPFGLEVGDIITTLNGQTIAELDLQALRDDLAAKVQANADAETDTPLLTLEVTRGGEQLTLESDKLGRFGGFGERGLGRGRGRGFDGRGRGLPGGVIPGTPETNSDSIQNIDPALLGGDVL